MSLSSASSSQASRQYDSIQASDIVLTALLSKDLSISDLSKIDPSSVGPVGTFLAQNARPSFDSIIKEDSKTRRDRLIMELGGLLSNKQLSDLANFIESKPRSAHAHAALIPRK
jgi:hypothetical protein